MVALKVGELIVEPEVTQSEATEIVEPLPPFRVLLCNSQLTSPERFQIKGENRVVEGSIEG